MLASFVIVNYNRREELLLTISKTIDLIKDHKIQYEIVIVDNGSTDGSADAVKNTFPDIVMLEKKVNTGAPAWNEGFDIAKGDYFIILDDDSHIESGLEEALHYIDARPQIGVLALNILTGPYTSKNWEMTEDRNIVGFIGCGAILRKETYKKIGGYADWIFLYGNEWEYGLRCLNAGYTVQFFEKCLVTHRTSALNRTNKRFDVLVTKHELATIYKYFPVAKWKYISRFTANVIKNAVKRRQFDRALYILQGAKDFMNMRSTIELTHLTPEDQKMFVKVFPNVKRSPFNFILKHFKKERA